MLDERHDRVGQRMVIQSSPLAIVFVRRSGAEANDERVR